MQKTGLRPKSLTTGLPDIQKSFTYKKSLRTILLIPLKFQSVACFSSSPENPDLLKNPFNNPVVVSGLLVLMEV